MRDFTIQIHFSAVKEITDPTVCVVWRVNAHPTSEPFSADEWRKVIGVTESVLTTFRDKLAAQERLDLEVQKEIDDMTLGKDSQ